jgi:tetratricopeptide (TPR) repeat protein
MSYTHLESDRPSSASGLREWHPRSLCGPRLPFLCLLLVCCLLGGGLLAPRPASGATEKAEVAYAKGILAYDQRNYLDALEHFRKAVELQPDNADAHFYVGLSLSRIGEFAEAITALETALRLDPSMDQAYYPLGLAYFQENRFKEALAAFERAAKVKPDDAATQFYLGFTRYKLGQYRRAIPFFERAMDLDPSVTLSAQYYRGAALYHLERDAQARQAFESTIATAPDSILARNAQGYLGAIDSRAREQQLVQVEGLVGYQYDDNVTLADDDIISGESDGRAILSFVGRLIPVRTRPLRLGIEYVLFQSLHFDLSEFDIQSHTGRVFARTKLPRVTFRVAADYNFTTLGGENFSEAVTVEPSARVRQTDALFAVISARYRNSDYTNQFIQPGEEDVRNRDGWSLGGGFDQYLLFNKRRSFVRLSYHFKASRNDGSDWEYDSHHVGVGVQTLLMPTVTLAVDGTYVRRDYLHVNSFDAPRLGFLDEHDMRERQDDRFTVAVNILLEPVRYVVFSAGFMHTTNISNINFFAYDRNVFTLAVIGRY